MALFSALHTMIFIISREYFDMKSELNFLVFWGVLGISWAACFRAEVKK
jgi:hypothetical protein